MFRVKFYQASSSEMFGSSYDIDEQGRKYQNEQTKFMPNSPYAISKCAAHYSVRIFRDAYGTYMLVLVFFLITKDREGERILLRRK